MVGISLPCTSRLELNALRLAVCGFCGLRLGSMLCGTRFVVLWSVVRVCGLQFRDFLYEVFGVRFSVCGQILPVRGLRFWGYRF